MKVYYLPCIKVIAFSREGTVGILALKMALWLKKRKKVNTYISPPIPHPLPPLHPPFLTLINGVLLLCFHQSFPSFFVSSPHPTRPPHALGCTLTCGILVLQPGIKPTPPAVEEWSLNHWTTREVPRVFHLCIFIPLLSIENYKWGVCVCVCVCVCECMREREGEGRKVRNLH